MQQPFPGETSVTLLMNDIEKCMMRHWGILVSLVLACGLGCKNSHNPPRTMTESEVVAMLGEVDDFELSDRVFGAASELTENKVDFEKEHEPLRTVSMVWFATGIIGNGGFRYLLECECGNDRDLRQIAEAFRRIDALECAQAFDELFAQFPNGFIMVENESKLSYYDSISEVTRSKIDSKFYSQSKAIPMLTASFIRRNREAILRELTRPN